MSANDNLILLNKINDMVTDTQRNIDERLLDLRSEISALIAAEIERIDAELKQQAKLEELLNGGN